MPLPHQAPPGELWKVTTAELEALQNLVDNPGGSATSSPVLLHNYRTSMAAGNPPSVLLFGDSMIAGPWAKLRAKVGAELGIRGHGFLTGVIASGAANVTNDCTKWITGNYTTVPTSGVVTFCYDGTASVEGDTLKLYYLQQSGGGTFKIQTKLEGGSWTDEASYLAVDTNGATAGVVITITKTTYRGRWQLRAVGVSGTSTIIGGGVRDSKLRGALLTGLYNSSSSSNNISDQSATPRAITDPILADLAPNLVVLSHYDGAAAVDAYQATLQNNIAAGIVSGGATAPSFVVVGPPPGYDDESDVAPHAQATAQRTLAASRGDTFYDNREWALPVSMAVSNGFMVDGDVHYQFPAQEVWISQMWSILDLSSASTRSRFSSSEFAPLGGGKLRAYKPQLGASYAGLESVGSFVVSRDIYGPTGQTTGELLLEDVTGPSDSNDYGKVRTNGVQVEIIAPVFVGSSQAVAFNPGSGNGYNISDTTSTAATPVGELGSVTRPFKHLNLGKTITAAATVGAQTINKATGSVNFAAAATSLVVTNSIAVAPTSGSTGSIIMATVRSNDTTMKSAAVVCSSNGSFTIYPNAAPTAETRVDFVIITP